MTGHVPTPAPAALTPSTALHGALLAPSQLAEWLTQLSMWSADGVSVEDAIARMQQSGLTLVQAGLVLRTYMALPDSEVPPT